LQNGYEVANFDITVGDKKCVTLEPLTDNRVNCKPPKQKPHKSVHDTFCHDDKLALQVSDCPQLFSANSV